MPQYYAKSIAESKTFWFNVLSITLVIFELKEVTDIIPGGWMPYVSMAIAVINVILRFEAKRPVALIPPGETKAVDVKAL